MKWLSLVALAQVAQCSLVSECHMEKVANWIRDDSSSFANSSVLIDLVPAQAKPSWARDRFSLLRTIELGFRYLYSPSDDDTPSNDPAYREVLKAFHEMLDVPDSVNLDLEFSMFDLLVRADEGDEPVDEANKLFKMGEVLFYGFLGRKNLVEALNYYQMAADEGHPSGQFMVGLAYSTGLFGNVEPDQAKASLYYTFAAYGGDPRAQMAIANRHYLGIAGAKEFRLAHEFYEMAADQSMDYYCSFDTGYGFRHLPYNAWVVADEYSGGIFGDASSQNDLTVSALRNFLQVYNSIEDGIAALEFSAMEEGHADYLKSLAKVYAYGVPFGDPDFKLAVTYAETALAKSKDDTEVSGAKLQIWAHSFLGDRYLRGEGVKFDVDRAVNHYEEGRKVADRTKIMKDGKVVTSTCAACHAGLGSAYLYYSQIEADEESANAWLKRAFQHFEKGAELGNGISNYYIAEQDFNNGRYDEAISRLKEHLRSPLDTYLLPKIYAQTYDEESARHLFPRTGGFHREAALHYRRTAEWIEDYHSPLRFAQTVFESDPDSALLGFLVAAEQGYHAAQVNVADMLDTTHSSLNIDWLAKWPVPDYVKSREDTALLYFTRASTGNYRSALLKVADYNYYGVGTPVNVRKAGELYSMLYRIAKNGIASWNLGWMHEYGIGVSRDYHLAKRYYDAALLAIPNSYIAVKLSLFILQLKMSLDWLNGRDDVVSPVIEPRSYTLEELGKVFSRSSIYNIPLAGIWNARDIFFMNLSIVTLVVLISIFVYYRLHRQEIGN